MIDKQPSISYFIDSNIWLYALIQSQEERKHKIANEVTRSENIFLSTQVVNEVSVNLIKKASLNKKEIQGIIASFYQSYTVLNFNEHILLEATELRSQYHLSFWDSLIVSSALSAKVSILLSEDMQNGLVIENTLEIVNPFYAATPYKK
jgi:predicted nucleic acid-binding protein